jgi:hypothetical protein
MNRNCSRGWTTTSSDSVDATIRYAAANGYVRYKYIHNKLTHAINITVTTGGDKMLFHVLLPPGTKARSVTVHDKTISFNQVAVEQSNYVDFETDADSIKTVNINYE